MDAHRSISNNNGKGHLNGNAVRIELYEKTASVTKQSTYEDFLFRTDARKKK